MAGVSLLIQMNAVLKPRKGLMALSERIPCWSMRLNGAQWSWGVCHMGNVDWMVTEGVRSDKQSALTVSFAVTRLWSREQLGYLDSLRGSGGSKGREGSVWQGVAQSRTE